MSDKQTTLMWLEDNLIGNPHTENDFNHNKKTWEQAKAMDKERMIEFVNVVLDNACGDYDGNVVLSKTVEDIYNEIYNKQDNGR